MAEKQNVGLTFIEGIVTGPQGQRSLRLLIDTGAQYSLLPHDVWTAIGLEPMRSMRFYLADSTPIDRRISECVLELPEVAGEIPRGHTPVILGESGDVALLGVVTLENLGLIFNPFDRSLKPMLDAPLMAVSGRRTGASASPYDA